MSLLVFVATASRWLCPYAPLIQMVSMDPCGRTRATSSCGWCLPLISHTIKSRSLFQIKNNQISRDVKGLFLGHRFVQSRVIVKVLMLQLEDELLEKGRGNVRCQGFNGLRGPLELGLGIRSSPWLGVK
jgi:hypothetical protein